MLIFLNDRLHISLYFYTMGVINSRMSAMPLPSHSSGRGGGKLKKSFGGQGASKEELFRQVNGHRHASPLFCKKSQPTRLTTMVPPPKQTLTALPQLPLPPPVQPLLQTESLGKVSQSVSSNTHCACQNLLCCK